MLRLLHPRRGSLAVLAVAIVLVFVVGGIIGERVIRARRPMEERALSIASHGDVVGAEALYLTLLDRGPITVPLLIAFLDNHARLSTPQLEMSGDDNEEIKIHAPAAKADDARVDALFASGKLSPDLAVLGTYWRRVTALTVTDDDRAPILIAADVEPPMPWSNHLLAREAMRAGHTADAATRFDREGAHFQGVSDERSDDVQRAVELWMAADDWDKVAERVHDPRYAPVIGALVRYEYAVHVRDWLGAIRWFIPANVSHATPQVYALAALAGLLWFWFCAGIGQIGEKKKLRIPLYVGAFVLGVGSIAMTLAIITVEEKLHFVEKKNPISDLIWWILGVGLREELSKLVFFAPLLLVTRRFGGRREVLTCGALVGLGFAAEENINYFVNAPFETALVRFLVANIFHMALTAISAMALDDFVRDRENHTQTLSRAFATVVVAHGLYDFFIGQQNLSFLNIVVFVYIARMFFGLVRGLRGREGRGASLLLRFVLSLAIVTGASFVYGTFIAGPALAAKAMAAGLLAEAIIIYFFVQELETM